MLGRLLSCFVADETLENLPLPTKVGRTKVGGIDFNKPRMRQVAEGVMALSISPTSPAGFTASDLAQKVCKMKWPSGSRLWAAARRLRSQEATGQRNGSQDRDLPPL